MNRLSISLITLAVLMTISLSGCVQTPPLPATIPPTASSPIVTLLPTWTQAPSVYPTATATSPPTATPTATPIPTSTPVPTPVAADGPHLLWQLINQERAQQGLKPLAYNDTLALAAQRHAEDCAQRGYGGHVGSDGAKLRERLKRVGYKRKWVTESWAWARTPQRAVFMWLDETPPDDPHRRMLLSPKLKEVGIGIAASNGGYYFIADFGR